MLSRVLAPPSSSCDLKPLNAPQRRRGARRLLEELRARNHRCILCGSFSVDGNTPLINVFNDWLLINQLIWRDSKQSGCCSNTADQQNYLWDRNDVTNSSWSYLFIKWKLLNHESITKNALVTFFSFLHKSKGFFLLRFSASQLLQENMTPHSCVSYKITTSQTK